MIRIGNRHGELLIDFSLSGSKDLFEYTSRRSSVSCDIRRGREQTRRTNELAKSMGVIEVPALFVVRNHRFLGVPPNALIDGRIVAENDRSSASLRRN